jgi:hypothetical protein
LDLLPTALDDLLRNHFQRQESQRKNDEDIIEMP